MSNLEQTLSIIKPDAVERNLDREIKEIFIHKGFNIVKEKKISHMDAVLWYCDENGLDPSQISSLISKSLKEKIQLEATNLRMLKFPKCGQLPI